MRTMSFKPLSVAAVLGASLLIVGCVSVGPTVTTGLPSFSLAPGASPTASPLVTLAPTLAPGATLPPITAAPPVTVPPVTIPPVTQPPVTQPPVTQPPPEPTPTIEHPDWPAGAVEGKEAHLHVGETVHVCGKVASARWVFAEKGHPTWLNFGQPYPNQRFNALIWGEQRRAWSLNGKPEVVYLDRIICVYGTIEMHQGSPQIQDLAKADIQVIP